MRTFDTDNEDNLRHIL